MFIKSGFVDVYGIKWGQAQINLYNKISAEIEEKEKLNFDIKELKDNRHRIYNIPFYSVAKKEG